MIYKGNENYIFVSYAHADSAKVLPVLEVLNQAGYRVWYDSGIEAGTEWPEYIEERLTNAKMVLVFMTPAAVESRNCRNEINFALELKKDMLVVYLEETTLLKGMRLQLNSSQSMFRANHETEESFINSLLQAKILQSCRAGQAQPEPVTPVQQTKAAAPEKPQKDKRPLFLLLGGILAALVILIGILAFGGKGGEKPKDNGDAVKPSPNATTPTSPVVEMSDKLLDYTLELEGKVYKLPCKYQDLTAAGWTISSSGVDDGAKLRGGSYEEVEMSHNGKTIYVTFYNPSGNSNALKDCPVGGIGWDVYEGPEGKLAKGITATATADEIVTAFGTPNDRSDKTDSVSLTYGANFNSVKFLVYTQEDMKKYSGVTLQNFVIPEMNETETNTTKPDYLTEYKAPTQLGTDYKTPIVKIGGDLYQLPAPVSAFTANGWKIIQQPGYVMSGNTESVQVERDGLKMYLYVENLADYQTTPENCAVYKCYAYREDKIAFELPGGIDFAATKEKVETVLQDATYYQGASNHSWTYSDYKTREYSLNVYVDITTQQVNQISISCKTWDYK